jgi:uncharacterized protein (TIGR02145 family)
LKAKSGWIRILDTYNGLDSYRSGNGLDTYGFAALPGGNGYSVGRFFSADSNGHWWSSTEYWWGSTKYSASDAYIRIMSYDYEGVSQIYDNKSTALRSVRCLQD